MKNIPDEEMKRQLANTADIVTVLDLAPPEKRFMYLKETGGVKMLFSMPSRDCQAKELLRNYQRHLKSRPMKKTSDRIDLIHHNLTYINNDTAITAAANLQFDFEETNKTELSQGIHCIWEIFENNIPNKFNGFDILFQLSSGIGMEIDAVVTLPQAHPNLFANINNTHGTIQHSLMDTVQPEPLQKQYQQHDQQTQHSYVDSKLQLMAEQSKRNTSCDKRYSRLDLRLLLEKKSIKRKSSSKSPKKLRLSPKIDYSGKSIALDEDIACSAKQDVNTFSDNALEALKIQLANAETEWSENQNHFKVFAELELILQELIVSQSISSKLEINKKFLITPFDFFGFFLWFFCFNKQARNIRNDFTVNVLEMYARFALEVGDFEEYNQRHKQLMVLYLHNKSKNYLEFISYRMVYNALKQNNGEIFLMVGLVLSRA